MPSKILTRLGALGVVAVAAGIAVRRRFYGRLRRIERRVTSAACATGPRSDLPDAVSALAQRIGVIRGGTPRAIHLRQIGAMRQDSGVDRHFTAREAVAVGQPAFLWRADFAPLALVHVADYFVDGAGGIEGRVLGLVPLLSAVDAAAAKGEIMRYLAELPWVPDAILFNRNLDWRVLDSRTLLVAAGAGASRGEVRLLLDEHGLIADVEADDRPRLEGGLMVERPWRGRFWDYREREGRRIPIQGEVAWLLDGKRSVYWYGTVIEWTTARFA